MEIWPLTFLILTCFMLLVVLLQAVLNKAVWWPYLWSVPVLAILTVLLHRGVIG